MIPTETTTYQMRREALEIETELQKGIIKGLEEKLVLLRENYADACVKNKHLEEELGIVTTERDLHYAENRKLLHNVVAENRRLKGRLLRSAILSNRPIATGDLVKTYLGFLGIDASSVMKPLCHEQIGQKIGQGWGGI